MKIKHIEQGSDEWFEFRKGKISGTRLGDIYAKRGGRKQGFYEVIAERLAIDADEENAAARGLRLEEDAVIVFEQVYGKKVDRVGVCVSDAHESIINSPDGLIKNKGKYTEALEIKCLGSASHIEAVITNQVPDKFTTQKIQYFVVNPDLQTLYFAFYDPRIASVPFHVIEVTRDSLDGLPEQFLQFQLEQLREIDTIVEELSF